MVSIAIIAILTALIIVNIASSRAKARDAKRIPDIAQIQLALEQYFTKNGYYPTSVDNYVMILEADINVLIFAIKFYRRLCLCSRSRQ